MDASVGEQIADMGKYIITVQTDESYAVMFIKEKV
jgi:hypothetical protein